MINHRSEEFEQILKTVLGNLRTIFGTAENVFILGGSGRTSVEASLINALSPGDKVLVGLNGNFGDMMATICKDMGFLVEPVGRDWNGPIDPADVEAALSRDPSIKTVAVVHNESSTGIVNDIKALAEVAHRHGAIIVVDGVSSVGGMPVNVDEWEIDICATGSQKCLMSPPGLGIVAVRQAAWKRIESSKSYRHYMDFRRLKELADRPMPQTPGTTPVSMVRCLDAACRMIMDEGIENGYQRHVRMARAARLGAKALGFSLSPIGQTSPTLITLAIDDSPAFLDGVMKEYALHLGRGLGKLSKSTFRIGIMGAAANEGPVLETLSLMGQYMAQHGFGVPADAGVEAAREALGI
jgi:aspartate aminotransferase-like enzyme